MRVTGFPKATYHYIRKQSKRPDKDKVYKDALLKLREKNKDYGYKRLTPELKKIRLSYKSEESITLNA